MFFLHAINAVWIEMPLEVCFTAKCSEGAQTHVHDLCSCKHISLALFPLDLNTGVIEKFYATENLSSRSNKFSHKQRHKNGRVIDPVRSLARARALTT